MKSNLHPTIAFALMACAPPPRTAEEEARFVAADLAEAAQRARPDYEQRRADRIERRDSAMVNAMAPRGLPGELA